MKNLLENNVVAPNMIVMGRGYDDNEFTGSNATDRFNQLVTMHDPYAGAVNPVLAMVSKFDAANAGRFSVDDEPELDAYVETLFLTDLGENAYTTNGDPYQVLDRLNKTTAVAAPPEPEPQPGINDDFMAAFGKVFK